MNNSVFTVGNNYCIVKVVDDKLVVSFDNGYIVKLTAESDVLELPITEYDLELLNDVVLENKSFSWGFRSVNGINVLVNFISKDEYDKRNK